MKKTAFCMLLFLLILNAVGCRREEKYITADEVSVNTMLAKSNGVLQIATVEDFDKGYYNLSELEEFIAGEINKYNKKAGDNKIVIDDVQQHGQKAVMLLSYSGMDQYTAFNEVSAAYFNGGVTDITLNLPATLVSVKDGSLASTEEVLKDTKYKILVINEPYNVIVDGKVKYYSEGVQQLDGSTVESASEGMTVIVFKP